MKKIIPDWVTDRKFLDFENGNKKVNRVAYSEGDIAYKIELMKKMLELGMELSYDAVGNICGFLPANGTARANLALCSHTDSITIPNSGPEEGAGQFDGTVGIIASLIAIENLQKHSAVLHSNIFVVNCACEESSRFAHACTGSKYLNGSLKKETFEMPDKIHKNSNITLGQAIAASEQLLKAEMSAHGIHAKKVASVVGGSQCDVAIELHIEQYESLANSGNQIGIISSIPGAYRFAATLKGKRDHSGAAPMNKRQDAMRAMYELQNRLYKLADENPGTILATFPGNETGKIVTNLTQDYVHFPSIDVRFHHPFKANEIAKYIEKAVLEVEHQTRVKIDTMKLSAGEAFITDDALSSKLHTISQTLGFRTTMMKSGAGHDVAYFPARKKGLIFIPSTGGSHNPQEHTTQQDIMNGAQVLEHTILQNDLHIH